jgi:hypothetical protein
MAEVLTNYGEEYLSKNGLQGAAFSVGLYNDTTDTISEADDLAQITTEPSNGNYARQAVTVASGDMADFSGQYGMEVSVTFDVTNTTGTVNYAFLMVNFQADGDGGATDHLVATAALGMDRDLSQNDTLNVNFRITLD